MLKTYTIEYIDADGKTIDVETVQWNPRQLAELRRISYREGAVQARVRRAA